MGCGKTVFFIFDKEWFSSFGARLALKQLSEHNVPFVFWHFPSILLINASINPSVKLDMSAGNPKYLKALLAQAGLPSISTA